jgi:GT2 family glycosyltransferase
MKLTQLMRVRLQGGGRVKQGGVVSEYGVLSTESEEPTLPLRTSVLGTAHSLFGACHGHPTTSPPHHLTTSPPPLLSIIIPSHNRADLLRACLQTVTRYAPTGSEILVIDDASPDRSVSFVASSFAEVRVLRSERRRGFCIAANAGIKAARGTIVELLNDDTEVTPGWAEPALAAFRDSAVAAVAPLVLCHPATDRSHKETSRPLVDSAGDCYYLGGVARKRGHRQPLDESLLRSCKVFGASASGAFFRRDALVEVDAFPESFEAYFEDVDLAFRLHWAGYQVLFEPASRVLHHVSASYGRPNRQLLEQQSSNEERVFWRNLPTPLLIRAVPHHLAVLAGKAWWRWEEGRLLPFFFGRLRLLGEIGAIYRHRRQLRTRCPTTTLRAVTHPGSFIWEIDVRYSDLSF